MFVRTSMYVCAYAYVISVWFNVHPWTRSDVFIYDTLVIYFEKLHNLLFKNIGSMLS